MKNKNKIIILTSIIIGVLVITLGLTYAAYNYTRVSSNQQLVLGDIYMNYDETNELTLENVMPSTTYDAAKYFEFTISGKNTYTKKDIWYEIVLSHGANHATRTERIKDNLLKFTLIEIKDGEETVVVDGASYEDLTSQRIWVNTIGKNTITETTITYRLYMWVSYDVIIGNISDANYDVDTWNNQVYGSIKVNVTGDFVEKSINGDESGELLVDTFREVLTTRTSTTIVDEEDGITYISGAADDNDPETTDDVDYNYVWYSGKMWRITSVNNDGTMKLITDKAITSISYGSDVNFYTDENNTSYMYQWLNEDFLDTLYNYENIIVTDSAWNVTDSNIETESEGPGGPVSGLSNEIYNEVVLNNLNGDIFNENIEEIEFQATGIESKLPTTEAEGATLVSAMVGLLNSYEYYKSYENLGSYSNGYLNIGYYWWLSNPYSVSSSRVWDVRISGDGYSTTPGGNTNGVRPSVNLKSTIQLARGTGIKSDPYRIKGDKEDAEQNITLLNTRSSGEYVNFDGELYRIVGIENNTTKLNEIDYVRDASNTVINKYFASTVTYGLSTNTQSDDYWDYYLNNTWYNSITSNYKSMLEKGTYYLGTVSSSAKNYKLAICQAASNTVSTKDCTKTSTTYSGYVGLPRYGEMFASQLGSGSLNSSNMCLITPYSTSRVWYVHNIGNIQNLAPSGDMYGVRPSIHLKSNVVIKGGSGIESDPYEIGVA